jgi:hypothetical protein
MRIRTQLGILICCCACAGLAACTATDPKGPDVTVTAPSVGRPAPPDSVQAALSRMAFTPYAALGLSANDGLAPNASTYALGQACLNVAGYPNAGQYAPIAIKLSQAGMAFSQPWGPWGYLGAADAQQNGFRVQPGSALTQLGLGGAGSSQPPDPATLPAAEQAAIGKCQSITQDFGNATASGALSGITTMGNDIATDVAKDAAVRGATEAWSACMTKNGYHESDPDSVFRDAMGEMYGNSHFINPNQTVSNAANQAQIAMAVTDADCTASADLAGIYFAVQASYEQQIVTANQQALTSAVQQYRTAYAKEVSDLPKLLSTAKAQPLPQPRAIGRKPPKS